MKRRREKPMKHIRRAMINRATLGFMVWFLEFLNVRKKFVDGVLCSRMFYKHKGTRKARRAQKNGIMRREFFIKW